MKTNNSIHWVPAVTNRIAGLSFLKEALRKFFGLVFELRGLYQELFWTFLATVFVVAVFFAAVEWLKIFYHVGSYYIALIGGA
jgi:hypothetical protein